MARQVIVLALIFVAIAGMAVAEVAPSASPKASPSSSTPAPKASPAAAKAPSASSPTPSSSGEDASISAPPAPASEYVDDLYAPEPAPAAADDVSSAEELFTPSTPESGATALQASVVFGVVAAFFAF